MDAHHPLYNRVTPLRHSRSSIVTRSFSWRIWFVRLVVAILLLSMIGLLILERQQHPLIARMRSSANDILVPVVDVASTPSRWIDILLQNVHSWVVTRKENVTLKNENSMLRQWQQRAVLLEAENRRLRDLLHMEALPLLQYASARVIGNNAASMEHRLFVRLPTSRIFTNAMAVMTHQGLVGRLQQVGTSTATILLCTDANSRIPVITENSRIKAILVGNNTDTPELHYLPDDTKLTAGEPIITTGDGGVFPAGIPVGVVMSSGSTPKVDLYMNRHTLEYVLIATEKGS
jgi:rod shape-determining protein MreC